MYWRLRVLERFGGAITAGELAAASPQALHRLISYELLRLHEEAGATGRA